MHLDPRQSVEGTEGLIEQQQLGLADEGPGDGRTLGLTTRQGLGPRVGMSGEADLFKGGQRSRPILGRQAEQDIVEHAGPGKEPRVLEHHGPSLRDEHLALDAVIEARQCAQHGALARSAGAQQSHELAGGDEQVDPGEDGAVAEAPAKTAGDDGGSDGGRLQRGAHGALDAHRPGCQRRSLASMARTATSVSSPRMA